MSLGFQTKIKALVSPRLLRRELISSSESEDDYKPEPDVKTGDIFIVTQDDEKIGSGQKAHMEIVKDQMNFHANFYTDSNKTYRLGSLTVDKCKISLSTQDLRVIQVSKFEEDEIQPSSGLLIKAKSQEDAMKWMAVMSR